MRVPLDELRRGLGRPAFGLWVRLLKLADRRGVVRATRSEMMNNGAGLSESSVKRSLERLRAAGLVTAAVSRKDPTRKVLGRLLAGDRADVPAASWRWARTSPGRGGRRRGAGRPPGTGEKSNRAEKRIKTGPSESGSMGKDSTIEERKAESTRPALNNGDKSNRAEKRIQTGPSQYQSKTDPDLILSPSLRSVDSMRSRGRARVSSIDDDAARAGDVPVLEGAEDVPVRSLKELLRLDVVPGLLLPDGRRAELGVRSPEPPPARDPRPPTEVLAYVARLWGAGVRLVYGVEDHRMNGVASSGGRSKLAKGVLNWYRACAEKEVKPAEWLLWELRRWHKGHPNKQPQIPGVLSERRVREGKVRRIFRITSVRLGGRVTYDEVGRAYLLRVQRLERALDALVATKLGRVTDDEVEDAVAEIFPKGAANAATILGEVDQRAGAETKRLADLAAAGAFVWADEQ